MWTATHEVERLAQLQLDLDSATGRFMTQCLRVSNEMPLELRDEWLRRAGLVEEFRDWTLRDCKRFVDDAARAEKGDAGAP